MSLTMQEICIFHLYNVPPSEMVRYTCHWDLMSACEYYRSLQQGNYLEQAATATLSVMEVYQIIQTFLTTEGTYADEDIMGAYIMDQQMYEKLRHYLYGDMIYKEESA